MGCHLVCYSLIIPLGSPVIVNAILNCFISRGIPLRNLAFEGSLPFVVLQCQLGYETRSCGRELFP